MMQGGHGRSGPAPADADTRHLLGTKKRRRRTATVVGDLMGIPEAPSDLSEAERHFWNYYAPQLAAERRLTGKARDVLAKYCTALAVVSGLRAALASPEIAQRSATRKELRQWLLTARLYENDLILNPASSLRALQPTPESVEDECAEFDVPLPTA
jgi:phage terminase small subunit